jgi:hypothetical protein
MKTTNQTMTLMFSRAIWESKMAESNQYSFTKEELDNAEKSESKFIGSKNGVDCYLQRSFDAKFNRSLIDSRSPAHHRE